MYKRFKLRVEARRRDGERRNDLLPFLCYALNFKHLHTQLAK